MEDTIQIVYVGGQGELITARGHVLRPGKPVALPADMAEYFLKERPAEFKRADAEIIQPNLRG